MGTVDEDDGRSAETFATEAGMEQGFDVHGSAVLPAPAAPGALRVSERTRVGLGVLAGAAGLGMVGDVLLRSTPWGLNLALWTVALVAAIAALQRWANADDQEFAWFPLALGVAAMMAWRDSPALKALDITALGIILGLVMLRARGGELRMAGLAHHAVGVAASAADAAVGAATVLFRDVRWAELRGEGTARHGVSIVRGGALALPLLLVFGSLLAAADARFERLVSGLFAFDAAALFLHVLVSLTIAWICGGILRTMTVGGDAPGPRIERPAALSLGIVEVGIVLGLLDLLFAAFVAVQLPYFFGAAHVLTQPGTATFSEYARRGFFELVTVAGLVLPLLLAMDWLVVRKKEMDDRVFRGLAGAQVALLFVIMASGLHRMRLYQGAYGMTELRLYTTAFMLWLGVVFAWFAWTVLRGQRERFAWGALTTALEAIVILHVVNPDAAIVRANAARADAPTRFDAAYAATLSADAVPPLLAAMPRLPAELSCGAANRLLARWHRSDADWRSWSLSRGRARAAVARRARELQADSECPEPSAIPPARPAMAAPAPAAAPPTGTAPAASNATAEAAPSPASAPASTAPYAAQAARPARAP
jgi:Domain of unknown function (DUF4173)